jgi:F-box protein 11
MRARRTAKVGRRKVAKPQPSTRTSTATRGSRRAPKLEAGLAPVAFLSYVRKDDVNDDGRISRFRGLLSKALDLQAGRPFQVFQDRDDITWGEAWQQRIDGAIDGTSFLIPVITPAYFKSVPCRRELRRFLRREKKLRRKDLIFPLYYVSCPELDDRAVTARNALAKAIARHNYTDWRELRLAPKGALRKPIDGLARDLLKALRRR